MVDRNLSTISVGHCVKDQGRLYLTTGSQALAEGSSEQASSLEEVSSSLQEMTAMTQQNTANSREAREITEATSEATKKGVDAMHRLSEAMTGIKESSDATAKIVKTIDEIAFQTNLLALNAAVEAARAGDAGKGFAVVAEEVRNLAMRSAEAAKGTAELIEGSVENAERGVVINEEVMAQLGDIDSGVQRVQEVMGEIAVASEQQGRRVDEINTAVEQMNGLTQSTAASAEESASAAEELTSQTRRLEELVGDFTLKRRAAGGASTGRKKARRSGQVAQVEAGVGHAESRRGGNGDGDGSAANRVAEELIPFDDGDLRGEF